MDDVSGARFQRHETLLARLAAILDAKRTTPQDEEVLHERLTTAIAHVETTHACIEALLTRMIRAEANGRDA